MALNYSLKYRKLTFFSKVVLEKDGEIVIDRQSFRLRGKGAGDQGETVYFADIKDFQIGEGQMKFTTWRKEQYILNDFSNLFDSFLKDFFRVRNEFLAEALMMKVGMLYHEYEGQVDILNRYGKLINRGKTRLQFYEGSIVFMPENYDCFVIYHNFLKNHEFDEDEYMLKLTLDTGSEVQVSKLGTSFEDVKETLESLLGKMYERLVHQFQEMFPAFDAVTLLKLVQVIREGKCISLQALKKIHEDLPRAVEDSLATQCSAVMQQKMRWLRRQCGDEYFAVGLNFSHKPDARDLQVKCWFLAALPDENVVALGAPTSVTDETISFFKIVMEDGAGRPVLPEGEEKLFDKILEINQSLYLSRFEMAPLCKDKHELKRTKYRTALRKLIFLRLLRKSLITQSKAPDVKSFEEDCQRIFAAARLKAPASQIAGVAGK